MYDVFKDFPNLEIANFLLRQVRTDDCAAIFEIYSKIESVKYQRNNVMESIVQAEKMIEYYQQGYKDRKFIKWFIATMEADYVIGLVTLHSFESQKAQFACTLDPKYYGKNIAVEACSKVISFAFTDMGLNQIEAAVHPDNISSIKMCEKLNFKNEGRKEKCVYNKKTQAYEDRILFTLSKAASDF